MKRRILDLTAAAILFELLFVLGTIVACQRLDSEKGETPHFGSSLAELQSKPKKKRKEERTSLNDKTLARPSQTMMTMSYGLIPRLLLMRSPFRTRTANRFLT